VTYLFKRYIGIEVGKPGEEGRLFDTLKIEFSLDRTSSSDANKGSVSIYNLNEKSRNLLNDEGVVYILKTGYQGLNNEPLIEELSSGDIEEIKTQKTGADVVTTFALTEDGKKLREKTTDQSFAEGVSKKQVIGALIETLDMAKGTIQGITSKVFNSGYSATGKVKDRLDELAKSDGLEWSVQNGEVNMFPKDTSTLEEAVYLSNETGLIRAYKEKAEGKDKTIVEALLNPQIKVGRKIQVEGQEVSGTFVVRRASYKGDNQNGPFMVTCEVA